MLGKKAIEEEIRRGSISVDNSYDKIFENSIRVHLSDVLKQYTETLDVAKSSPTNTIIIPECGLKIALDNLYLGRTDEYTKTYGFVPILIGTDELAAIGVEAHITAGFGDNGFEGTWTLEIWCTNETILYTDMPIGEIIYLPVIGEHKYYRGKYYGQIDTTESRLSNEYNEEGMVLKYVDKQWNKKTN